MITKIKGKHFKSGNFIHDLDRLNLFLGENGSGKTAISQALQLVVNGFIPGIGKTNQSIFQAVAESGSDFVEVEAEINRVYFLKRFKKGTDGAVALDFAIRGRKATAKAFDVEMARAGIHAIGDLSSFMGVSDRKKIEALFDKYPPSPGLEKVARKLDQAREDLNEKRRALGDAERNHALLKTQRATLPVPKKTLEACQGDLEFIQAELRCIKGRIEEMKEQEKSAGKAELLVDAETQELKEDNDKFVPDERYLELLRKSREAQEKAGVNYTAECTRKEAASVDVIESPETVSRKAVVDSLKIILESVKRSGCGEMCAALMVIKREIKNMSSLGVA
jgi:hypothetical protein